MKHRKKIKFPPWLLTCGIFFSLLMLFFTFFAFGWFSDVRGFDGYFEIPVNTKNGALSLVADLFWVAAPFFLLTAFCLSFQKKKKTLEAVSVFAASLPLTLYALLQLVLFTGEKEGHFSLIVTYTFLLLAGFLSLYSIFVSEMIPFAAILSLVHCATEVILLILSIVFGEKYSQFYFSQILPMGKLSGFRFSFFLISIFIFIFSYSLALALFHLHRNRKPDLPEEVPAPSPKKTEEEILPQEEMEPDVEENEEEEEVLTLQDFGIER